MTEVFGKRDVDQILDAVRLLCKKAERLEPPDTRSGIYVLYQGQCPVYVGQAAHIGQRVTEHWLRPKHPFTSIEFYPCSVILLDLAEYALIRLLRPGGNRRGPNNPKKDMSATQLRRWLMNILRAEGIER